MKDDNLHKRIEAAANTNSSRILEVNISSQRMTLTDGKRVLAVYPVSTSRYGIGNAEGSNQTPLGLHRLVEKYGADAPTGRIFESRKDTGKIWKPGMSRENMILTRILRLEGLEAGVNKGKGIDSYARYIYIHGTNNEEMIGTPISHGCICMRNDDIIGLFDSVTEGDLVIIHQ
ncbi:MAG: L,D-transpeptidase family protein [Chitinivibrionales bacterium]|nr:L,D-transpeptidase family protein [Chitinivibrionales bacterium]